MKRIIKRRNGEALRLDEARQLARQLKGTVSTVEHRAVCGYPTAELAKKANLTPILETYTGYTFAYVGTEYLLSRDTRLSLSHSKIFHKILRLSSIIL